MLDFYYKKFIKLYISEKNTLDNNKQGNTELTNLLIYHLGKIPDYLSLGIRLIATLFMMNLSLYKFILFLGSKKKIIENLRLSNIALLRNLIRFHDSLFEVAIGQNIKEIKSNYKKITKDDKLYDFVIIGSGPGGAVSAKELQKRGYEVLLLEKGENLSKKNIDPFTYSEMISKYKNAGVNITFGGGNIAFVEGMTLGGGSEVNSGLYHRTPKALLDSWRKTFLLKGKSRKDLEKYFARIEEDLSISYYPKKSLIPKASLKLEFGAKKLDWNVSEIPRWFKYEKNHSGKKMTMSQTYLKEYSELGGILYTGISVNKLIKKGKNWQIEALNNKKSTFFNAKNILMAAGTIESPMILKRSNLKTGAGRSFQMHPTVKVVALFDEEVNQEGMGVPVHQVKEFSNKYSFGCSISSKPYLKMAMLSHRKHKDIVSKKWRKMAIYYVMIIPKSKGKIVKIPIFNDPLIYYRLAREDKKNLSEGLQLLCKLLFKANAVKLFPCIENINPINNVREIKHIPKVLNTVNSNLMTIHLFSSCPIGENRKKCVANSYGKVFGFSNLFIADGSMIPTAPGVNPQGTIMAFAHSNIDEIVKNL